MPLVPTADIVAAAVRDSRAIAAFNVVQIEHAEGLVTGAEAVRAPVVLQISQNAVRYHDGNLEPIAVATLAIARASSVPVAVHLDHATELELIRDAVRLGFGSVMYDGSRLDYESNVSTTADVAAYCHGHDVFVEAELGEVGGKDGVHDPGVRTDPQEARSFVARTRVDALAVAVGTSHAMQTRSARLDLDLVRRLRRAVPVPLVLHGSSGVADDDLVAAVAAGLTKINVATRLNAAFTAAVRAHLAANVDVADTRSYLRAGREALATEASRLLGLLQPQRRSLAR